MPRRVDSPGSFSAAVPNPVGGLRLLAGLTRPGVFPYTQRDGSVRLELRPPEEVYAPAALATILGAPVTFLHPVEDVSVMNHRSLMMGHAVTAPEVRESDGVVQTYCDVNDPLMIQRILSGEIKEISCGYDVDIDETPGVWEGQRYDVVQRNMRYNHIAGGPENWGRMGPLCAFRNDSGYAEMVREEGNMLKKIKLQDGTEIEVDEKVAAAWAKMQDAADPTKVRKAIDSKRRFLAMARTTARTIKLDVKPPGPTYKARAKDADPASEDPGDGVENSSIVSDIVASLYPGLDMTQLEGATPVEILLAGAMSLGLIGAGAAPAADDMPEEMDAAKAPPGAPLPPTQHGDTLSYLADFRGGPKGKPDANGIIRDDANDLLNKPPVDPRQDAREKELQRYITAGKPGKKAG